MPPSRPTIGPYEILDELGRGGVGVVYRARCESLSRPVALKLILRARANPTALGRFEREAHALAKVRHPNVVRVHELGVAEQGPYLVTELVDGQSLDALSDGSPLSPRRAAEITRDLAGALAAIHALGIVHRDLKPGNVLIRPDGSPVLLDFGLARDTESGDRLTQTGMITGTPSYMAPEQATGESAKNPDLRTDVYGLGATLYTLLTGEAPFVGSSGIQVLAAIMQGDPEWPGVASLPPGLVAICRHAMAHDVAGRYPSADALRDDLELWLTGEYSPKGPRLWLAVAGAVGALLLVLGIAFGAGLGGAGSDPDQASRGSPAPPATTLPPAPPLPPATLDTQVTQRPVGRWTFSKVLAPQGPARGGAVLCEFIDDTRAVSANCWLADVTVWDFAGEGSSRSLELPLTVRRLAVGGERVVLPVNERTSVLVLDVPPTGPLKAKELRLGVDRGPGDSSIQSIVVTPDGDVATLGYSDGHIRRIELPGGAVIAEVVHSRNNGVAALALRDGVLVSTSSASGDVAGIEAQRIGKVDFRVRFWRAVTLTAEEEFRISAVGAAVCISSAGESVFVGTNFGHVKRWARDGTLLKNMKGERVEKLQVGGRAWAIGGDLPRAHSARVQTLRLGPMGKLYSVGHGPRRAGGRFGELSVWDVDAGEQISEFRGVSGRSVTEIAISPNGRRALIGYWSGKLELWER